MSGISLLLDHAKALVGEKNSEEEEADEAASLPPPPPSVTRTAQPAMPNPEATLSAELSIDEATSELEAGGFVDVVFSLQTGSWVDGDVVGLVCAAGSSTDSRVGGGGGSSSVEFEVFEYVESDTDRRLRVKLPTYGGRFVVVYCREWWNGTCIVKAVVGQSQPFFVSFPVYPCKPDELLPGGRSVRRRSAGAKAACPGASFLLEDMRNTQTLSVSMDLVLDGAGAAAPSSSSTTEQTTARTTTTWLNRVMAWIYRPNGQEEAYRIVLELDAVMCDGSGSITQKTVFAECVLPSLCSQYTIDTGNSRGELTNPASVCVSFSYRYQHIDFNSFPVDFCAQLRSFQMSCRFCEQPFLSSQSIRRCNQLPSGQFDDVSTIIILIYPIQKNYC